MAKKKTDLELIKEFQKGKQSAFEELVNRYSAKAFNLATRLTRNQQDAEEVLQDVFVTVYRKIGGFEGKSSFSSWLYRVTMNASLMKLRKKRQTSANVSMEEMLPVIENSPALRAAEHVEVDAVASRNELVLALEDAVLRLPEEYRPVFILRDIDGLTSREVGKILNLTVPAVKSRLHRSRLMLRRRLAKFYKEFRALETAEIPTAGNA
jgi:RNA polymerase sigma-70 factor (ECF subfamily)